MILVILLATHALVYGYDPSQRDNEISPHATSLLRLSHLLGHQIAEPGLKKEIEMNWRTKRDPFGINARGFHDDVFSRDFGNFKPYKRNELYYNGNRNKRSTVTEGSSQKGELEIAKRKLQKSRGEQDTLDKDAKIVLKPYGKRYYGPNRLRNGGGGFPKRRPTNDFYGDAFTHGFGDFSTMKKRRPSSDFHGDAFTEGFGDFETMKKRKPSEDFHGDVFTQGFGDFNTMRKRRPDSGFHDNIFTQGFGDFDTMRKRRPENDFHDNIFTQGFGDFDTMKKRRPSDDFHGDAFTQGFGDFSTMKKRRPSDDFHGDAFTQGFGDFSTMKKRRPTDDFHGDAFTQGFGDFTTMRKRRPSDDFHGDAFTEGFGDFSTMKKREITAEDGLEGTREIGVKPSLVTPIKIDAENASLPIHLGRLESHFVQHA